MVSPFMLPRYTLNMSEKQSHDSLHAKRWIGEKACLMTSTPERPWPSPGWSSLPGCPRETCPGGAPCRRHQGRLWPSSILKGVLNWLWGGTYWVSIANITNQFILELDVMHTHYAFVDLRLHVLQLGNEVPLQCCGVQSQSSPLYDGQQGGRSGLV
jgi:hypothetical protein